MLDKDSAGFGLLAPAQTGGRPGTLMAASVLCHPGPTAEVECLVIVITTHKTKITLSLRGEEKTKKGQLNPSTLSMQPTMQPTGNHSDKNLSG